MRSHRLRIGVLMAVVWTAAVATSVSRAEQSASRAPANSAPSKAATPSESAGRGTVGRRSAEGRQPVLRRVSQLASDDVRDGIGRDPGQGRPDTSRRLCRHLGEGDQEASRRRDATGWHAASRCGDAERVDLVSRDVARSTSGNASQSRSPSSASTEPRRVPERDSRSAGARSRRLRRCCRRTTRWTASTTTPTRSACRRRCSSGTSRRPRRSARSPSATPRSAPSSETYRIRGDASQTSQNEALPPGTRGGLMALHTFPLDGEYVIKVKLLEINLGSIRGLEYRASARGHCRWRACAARAGRRPRGLHAVVAQRDQRGELARRAAAGAREGQGGPAQGRRGISSEIRRRRAATGCSRSSAARSSRPITWACLTSRT